jgi:ubiquinone/menaquinone biosynthesis C-methylase UbiE
VDVTEFGLGDELAAAWEHNRDRLFESVRPVSEWIVNDVDPEPDDTILELTAGPGETGFLAAERVGSEGRLISSDLSPGMVAAARRGAEARGLSNVECRIIDAQAIDLPDSSVDGVLSRFGVMLVPEPPRVLAEARRVLRSGRRFAYAVWGPAARNPWLTSLVAALLENGHVPPVVPDADAGPFTLADPEANRVLLANTGFTHVRVDEITGVMDFADIEDYFSLQSSVGGPIAPFVASLTNAQRETIIASVGPILEPFRREGNYQIPYHAIAAGGSSRTLLPS